MWACHVLSETDASFRIGGFGSDGWGFDIRYDMSAFVEELPCLIDALRSGRETEIDLYPQGVERTLTFSPAGERVLITCVSAPPGCRGRTSRCAMPTTGHVRPACPRLRDRCARHCPPPREADTIRPLAARGGLTAGPYCRTHASQHRDPAGPPLARRRTRPVDTSRGTWLPRRLHLRPPVVANLPREDVVRSGAHVDRRRDDNRAHPAWHPRNISQASFVHHRLTCGYPCQMPTSLICLPHRRVMSSTSDVSMATGPGCRSAASATVASMAYLCP